MRTKTNASHVAAAARELIDAIMDDEGGFSLHTLNCMVELGGLVDAHDRLGVVSSGRWAMESDDEDHPRFWGKRAWRRITKARSK